MRYSRPSPGFSLIEVLVCVILIAILAALIMPMIGALRSATDSARCTSNLRIVGGGALNYFVERNGLLLTGRFWYSPSTLPPTSTGIIAAGMVEYFGIEGPYTGDATLRDTVLTCPGLKKKSPALFPSQWNRCYSVNQYAHAYGPENTNINDSVPLAFPGNLARIRSRSSMWLFMDAAVSDTGGYPFTYIGRSQINDVRSPHSGKQNIVFFDGHVEQLDAATIFSKSASSDLWGGPLP